MSPSGRTECSAVCFFAAVIIALGLLDSLTNGPASHAQCPPLALSGRQSQFTIDKGCG
jgi:hypothetical protein